MACRCRTIRFSMWIVSAERRATASSSASNRTIRSSTPRPRENFSKVWDRGRYAKLRGKSSLAVVLLPLTLLVASCRQDMHDQPKYKPLAGSSFFDDRRASRPLLPGAIARGHLREDTRFYT